MTQFADILDSSIKLYATYGIKSVSVDDISHHLSISKKTLYKCITNKETLLEKITQHIASNFSTKIKTISKELENDKKQQLTDIAVFILGFSKEYNLYLNDLEKYHHNIWADFDQEQHNRIVKIIEPIYYKLEQNRQFIDVVDKELFYHIYLSICRLKDIEIQDVKVWDYNLKMLKLLIAGLFV